MKPTLNQRRIDFIFVCLLVSSLLACKKQASNSMAGMPILYPEPKTVPYNDQGGYILNQFTGDTIRPIVNGVGDTIETGISAMIKGHVIRPDTENTEWVQ